jgi:hypothetical protein
MGEIIPVDGVVLDGFGVVDTSSITGEFLPREVSIGDDVASGCVLNSDSITIKVAKTYSNSTISKILDLVSNSGESKSKAEKFITKFAKVYTPVVLTIALIVGVIPPLFTGEWVEYIYRALIFLVISCPCAIIISVPLTYFTGLGLAAKNGIMIKGGNYLDELCRAGKVLLDKTGTLTHGRFFVQDINTYNDYSKDDVLEYTAYAESISNHPIAKSIVEHYGKNIDKTLIKNMEEKSGFGVKVNYNNKEIIVGSDKWLNKFGVKIDPNYDYNGSVVWVSIDGKLAGVIGLKDKIKDTAKQFVDAMKNKRPVYPQVHFNSKKNKRPVYPQVHFNSNPAANNVYAGQAAGNAVPENVQKTLAEKSEKTTGKKILSVWRWFVVIFILALVAVGIVNNISEKREERSEVEESGDSEEKNIKRNFSLSSQAVSGIEKLRRSAQMGSRVDQYKLREAYELGEGIQKDMDQALYWYNRAAQAGDHNAALRLGIIYENMNNFPMASQCYQRAVYMGNTEAQRRLNDLNQRMMNNSQPMYNNNFTMF